MATLKNTIINDTGNLTVASGTTAERPATPVLGMLRYNTTLDVLEQYTETGWQGIEAPPVISGFSGVINADTNSTITINGANFKSGSVVSIEGAAVTGSRSLSTTFVGASQLTAATNAASVNFTGGATFDIKVTNPSGLSALLSPAGTVDRDPVWSTTAGNLGTMFASALAGRTFTLSASDPDGQAITYSIASGSLPTGMSLNSSTGVISGTASSVGSDTTFSFTARASSTSGALTSTADRAFNIIVRAPVVVSFTSTGSNTFSVPTGLTAVEVLVVGGGGAGGSASGYEAGGGGGAGGVLYSASVPVSPGGTVPVTVGTGGNSITNSPSTTSNPGMQGSNSTFGPLTAIGGGFGGGQYWSSTPGGSGGGQAGNSAQWPSGSGGTPGQGNSGAAGSINGGASAGGGGGGNTGNGSPASGTTGGPGGNGGAYSITGSSVTYGGGGGGAGSRNGGGGGSGGPGGGGAGTGGASGNGTPGTTNRGGGGGGSCGPTSNVSGTGGPGIVIVRY